MRRTLASLALLLAIGTAAAALGQDFIGGRREPMPEPGANQPYDGRLTFVRLRYNTGFGGRRWEPPWAHDYPTADVHMMKILNELTLTRPRLDGSNVMSLADPELHNYPIAYMSEPGYWAMDEDEVKGLRAYLAKGGFMIFDDFRARDWDNLQEQMRLAFPTGQWFELDPSHPIFHSFFEITAEKLDDFPQAYNAGRPVFRGVYEDNDPAKRLVMIVNYNTDISQFWEWSGRGLRPVGDTNEAYKLGVNYFIYGLTH